MRKASAERVRALPWAVPLVVTLLSCCTRAHTLSPATTFAVPRPGSDVTGARYAAVHVDHLQPGSLSSFVEARRTWLEALSKHGTTDGRGLFVQTGDSGFLSIRPLRAFADLDGQAARFDAALAAVDPKDRHAYDRASDALLAPPHRNELWRYDEELSYRTIDPVAELSRAAWGKMTVEEVDPTPAGDAYGRAWKEIRAALVAADYPLVRVTYSSHYGTGNLVTFWLAKSQQEFLETRSVEATVTSALGADVAGALLGKLQKAVLASDSVDVIPRLDLSTRAL